MLNVYIFKNNLIGKKKLIKNNLNSKINMFKIVCDYHRELNFFRL